MAITDESNGMVMPVAPMYGGGYGNNGGFGGMGGDWAWIILLLLLAGNGGWGFGGGFGGMGGFAADGAMLYPWMNQAEITTQGFQNSAHFVHYVENERIQQIALACSICSRYNA